MRSARASKYTAQGSVKINFSGMKNRWPDIIKVIFGQSEAETWQQNGFWGGSFC